MKEEEPGLVAALASQETKIIYQTGAEGIVLAAAGFIPAEQPESEMETEELTEEATENESEMEAEESESIFQISADWEGDSLGIGDRITLTALCGAEDTVEWQSCGEDGVWTVVAEGQIYSYELTMENYSLMYRAVPADQAEVSES